MSVTTATESFQVPPEVVHGGAGGDEGAIIDAVDPIGEKRRRKLVEVPRKYRAMYRAGWARKSRKAAIRAFCLECVCYMPSEVRLCTSPDCPLYEFRLEG